MSKPEGVLCNAVRTAIGTYHKTLEITPARQAAIGGRLPAQVPAMMVNRVCGSGAQGIASTLETLA